MHNTSNPLISVNQGSFDRLLGFLFWAIFTFCSSHAHSEAVWHHKQQEEQHFFPLHWYFPLSTLATPISMLIGIHSMNWVENHYDQNTRTAHTAFKQTAHRIARMNLSTPHRRNPKVAEMHITNFMHCNLFPWVITVMALTFVQHRHLKLLTLHASPFGLCCPFSFRAATLLYCTKQDIFQERQCNDVAAGIAGRPSPSQSPSKRCGALWEEQPICQQPALTHSPTPETQDSDICGYSMPGGDPFACELAFLPA